ncbi:MAG: hypothetical protein ABI999_12405 [Acidobacteriota bacterium]
MRRINIDRIARLEITFTDSQGNTKTEALGTGLGATLAIQQYLTDKLDEESKEGFEVTDVNFFVEIYLQLPGQETIQPERKFGLRKIEPKLLRNLLSHDWIDEALTAAQPEIDDFILEKRRETGDL